MTRFIMGRGAACLAALLMLLSASVVPASAANTNPSRVLSDYADNGLIDQCHTPEAIVRALKTVGQDQQQYGAIVDILRQALQQGGGAPACHQRAPGAASPDAATAEVRDASASSSTAAAEALAGDVVTCFSVATMGSAIYELWLQDPVDEGAVQRLRDTIRAVLRDPGHPCVEEGVKSAGPPGDDAGLPVFALIPVMLALGLIAVGAELVRRKTRS